ncbi:type II toxin-antitoxin system VapC family toxin [Candidatus Dependentiae bacterium]|nr:type II toxin-antitoxin system VapC family toxin [Candidatus Dependentiae bacterium]
MKLFFDTSAIAKRYIYEKGSEDIEKLLYAADEVCISMIAISEIFSALNRLIREKKILRDQYNSIKKAIYVDVSEFSICNITPEIIESSIFFLEKSPLKAMDSIQLACAFKMNIDTFISSDRKQIEAAKDIGLNVLKI